MPAICRNIVQAGRWQTQFEHDDPVEQWLSTNILYAMDTTLGSLENAAE